MHRHHFIVIHSQTKHTADGEPGKAIPITIVSVVKSHHESVNFITNIAWLLHKVMATGISFISVSGVMLVELSEATFMVPKSNTPPPLGKAGA